MSGWLDIRQLFPPATVAAFAEVAELRTSAHRAHGRVYPTYDEWDEQAEVLRYAYEHGGVPEVLDRVVAETRVRMERARRSGRSPRDEHDRNEWACDPNTRIQNRIRSFGGDELENEPLPW
jgi:hypothetical protein